MTKDEQILVGFSKPKSDAKGSTSTSSSKEYTFDRELFAYRVFSFVGTTGIFLMVIAALRVLYMIGLKTAAEREAAANGTTASA